MRSVFDDPHIDEISADDLLGDYPAVQYGPPEGPFHIDLLTRLGELHTFASLASERVDFGGVMVSVVTPATLFRMKRGTVRPKDHIDAAPDRPQVRAHGGVMSVRKLRDVSEIERPTYEPGSRRLFEVIRHVWSLSDRICPLRFPAGVFKHRSIEDAERLRETWEDANFQAHQARKANSSRAR